MELGFLQRLRESDLWDRIGWIYGTSAGALTGTMAALDRLDELEDFMLRLQPDETFRPHSLWRLPLLGSHDYRLPETVAERLGDVGELARQLAGAPVEVVVSATDVTESAHGLVLEAKAAEPPSPGRQTGSPPAPKRLEATAAEPPSPGRQTGSPPAPLGAGAHAYELVYSSRTTPPERFAQAVLASAAVSALVLPRRVGDHVVTDGAWVRNFPLGHAYHQPGVELIVSFRYEPTYPHVGTGWLATLRRRLERFPKIPPLRALSAELVGAEEREARGEPAHWGDMIVRLMRVAVQQNTVLEERIAREKDASVAELEALREDVERIVRTEGGRRGERIARAVSARFDAAAFPFLGDRLVPRISVSGGAGELNLETGLRNPKPWDEAAKRELIARGYALLDEQLAERAVA